ncbi:MAG: hypothetical protein RSF82_02405 [Angelakisella sp.]
MTYRPVYYGEDENDSQVEEKGGIHKGLWSGVLGDVDDFIFYYSGGCDEGEMGEYRSTR